jgi:hypothetical protein
MLPSDHLALAILRFARDRTSESWRPTSLPALATALSCNDWTQVTDSLKILHQRRLLRIQRWDDSVGFVAYEGEQNNSDFFHRGDFQIAMTFEGRPYLEMLESQAKPLSSPPITAAALELDREPLLRLGSIAKALAEMPSPNLVFNPHFADVLAAIVTEQKLFHESFRAITLTPDTKSLLNQRERFTSVLSPTMESFRQIGEGLASQVVKTNELFRQMEALTFDQKWLGPIVEQSLAISAMNLELPKILAEAWEPKILSQRIDLLGDTLKNVTLWERWRDDIAIGLGPISNQSPQPIALDVAGQFVFGHGTLIRRLPPTVPADEETLEQEEQFRYRDEEIGAKLETRLALLGPQFVALRRTSWKSMQGGEVAGARIAMAGIRELSTDILHLLAPDEDLKQTDIWLLRKDLKLTRPTRRMRIQFIAGPAAETFDALVQFDESMLHAHQFTHTFASDPELVRIALSQLENCIYMLLISSKR